MIRRLLAALALLVCVSPLAACSNNPIGCPGTSALNGGAIARDALVRQGVDLHTWDADNCH